MSEPRFELGMFDPIANHITTKPRSIYWNQGKNYAKFLISNMIYLYGLISPYVVGIGLTRLFPKTRNIVNQGVGAQFILCQKHSFLHQLTQNRASRFASALEIFCQLWSKSWYILRRPLNFAKSPSQIWPLLHRTNLRWRLCKNLWPSQNTWTLHLTIVFP